MFIQNLFTDFQFFFWWFTIMVLSVCVHEFFHAWAAHYEGDDTAKQAGFFTLNPMVHMGPASLIILVLTGMCWGACPVNPNRFRHRYGDALVAFAGPFANLLLMVLFALATLITLHAPHMALSEKLIEFCRLASMLNAALFLLNMIPLPPLDGHAVVRNFFPETAGFYNQIGFAGYLIVFVALSIPVLGHAFWGLATTLSVSTFLLFGMVLG